MAEEIYYYIMDKHGVIYGRSTSKTRLQEKMKTISPKLLYGS